MKLTHDNVKGYVALDGVWIAWTSPQGWRPALTHPAGDTIIRSVRMAIWSESNGVSAQDLCRTIRKTLELEGIFTE